MRHCYIALLGLVAAYGTDGEWREDWDLGWDEGEVPPELLARFDDPSAFCSHP